MRHLRRIPINLIDVDRLPIGRRTTALIDHLRTGKTVPPIHVVIKPEGRFQILDGRHRILAHRMLEIPTILARFATPRER